MTETIDVDSRNVPDSTVHTRIYVVAGGPCSGKTTTLEAIADRGYRVEWEPAEQLLNDEVSEGKSAEEVREDPQKWQRRVVNADFELFNNLPRDQIVFADTSLVESCVFSREADMEFGTNLRTFMDHLRYASVFFLDPLDTHEETNVRLEDRETARQLSERILDTYREFNYDPISVPVRPVDERVDFILDRVSRAQG